MDALIPYTTWVRQFKAPPPGKLYLLHGGDTVFRLSLSAAAYVLLKGVPLTLVDGTNRFDVYYIAEFARKVTSRRVGGTPVAPEHLLDNIFISRAFTCYQMEALVTERLPEFVRKVRSPVVIIFGLLDTFYDEQAPLFEVRGSLQRITTALLQLKQEGISLLLASRAVRPASKGRDGLFQELALMMDRVFSIRDEEGRLWVERRLPRGNWPEGS
jgi:hypothetical protein